SLTSSRVQPLRTPLPYTTLFRSQQRLETVAALGQGHDRDEGLLLEPGEDRHRGELAIEEEALKPHAQLLQAPDQIGEHVQERFRSEEHTSELQSRVDLVCRLLLE